MIVQHIDQIYKQHHQMNLNFVCRLCLACLLVTEAESLSCPDKSNSEKWGQVKLYGDALTVSYATVTSSDERSVLCARLESELESYIGFGVSPLGRMLGGEAIIGRPDDGTVMKYNLIGSPRGVSLMENSNQTLMDEQITQIDGRTIMTFTKYMQEEGEHEILETGENVFLFAIGKSNTLDRKHWASGVFRVDFGLPGRFCMC